MPGLEEDFQFGKTQTSLQEVTLSSSEHDISPNLDQSSGTCVLIYSPKQTQVEWMFFLILSAAENLADVRYWW